MTREPVAVVIPTFDGGPGLARLLDAIATQAGHFRPQIVAVDSGSTDGTLALLRSHGARIVMLAPGTFNHGDTRNRALDSVETRFAVLIVQDAVPADSRWLDALVTPLVEDESLAGSWARQLPDERASHLTRYYHARWLGAATTPRIAGPLTTTELSALSPAGRHAACAFDNVCSCIRMSVWRRHRFPPVAFAEDIEWAATVLQAGHRLAFVPEAAVRHSHERPVIYELRRTRVAHARLHRLFGLSTVPSLSDLARAVAASVPLHVALAWKEPRKRGRALGRALGLAVAWPLGQYFGARDSRAGRVPRVVRGL